MKNLIICLLLFSFISTGHSQILLEEAKVDYQRKSMKLDPNSNTLVLKVHEKIAGEFQKDPLSYVKDNFDIKRLITENKGQKYDEYTVHFKSKKGFLETTFRGNGDLKSSYQQFKNIRLPEIARFQVLEKYRNATITGTKYTASTKGWNLDNAYYKVKIKDENNKTRRMRIDRQQAALTVR